MQYTIVEPQQAVSHAGVNLVKQSCQRWPASVYSSLLNALKASVIVCCVKHRLRPGSTNILLRALCSTDALRLLRCVCMP
jgi:hypothetical protein